MLEIQKSCLIVVDVQGKLAQLMYEKEHLFHSIQILIKAAHILRIPVLWCQQCPQSLGPTVPQIAELLGESEPINKASFSCCSEQQFTRKLKGLARSQLLLCGIEAHVCIYQTAVDLLGQGYDVTVLEDATSSRTPENKQVAIRRMPAEGAHISSVEMALFELLRTAEHPQFKQIARLIK